MQEHVTINLPTGWLVPDIPQAQKLDLKAATYSLMAENNKSSLHVKRQLVLSLGTVDVKYYPTLRSFFQHVRTADEQQVIVSTGTAAALN